MTPNVDQQKAIDLFCQFIADPTQQVFLLEGPPGTGKTFTVSHMLQEACDLVPGLGVLQDQENFRLHVALTGSTHDAANNLLNNLSEEQKRAFVSVYGTIDKFMGWYPRDTHTFSHSTKEYDSIIVRDNDNTRYLPTPKSVADEQLKACTALPLIVIDEAFMLNEDKIHNLREELKTNKELKVLLIQDPDQLSPIPTTTNYFELVVIEPDVKVELTINERATSNLTPLIEELRNSVRSETKPNLSKFIGLSDSIRKLSMEEYKAEMIQKVNSGTHTSTKSLGYMNKPVNAINAWIRTIIDPTLSEEEASTIFSPNEVVISKRSFYSFKLNSSDSDILQNNPRFRLKPSFGNSENFLTIEDTNYYGFMETKLELNGANTDISGMELVSKNGTFYMPNNETIPCCIYRSGKSSNSYFLVMDYKVSTQALKDYKGLAGRRSSKALSALNNVMVNPSPDFAKTVRSAQGKTYEHVYIFLDDLMKVAQHSSMDSYLRHVYVAASRASKSVTFVTG